MSETFVAVPTTVCTSPEPASGPNVRLHAKVPLLALLGLVHLRITLAFAVLGRTGRGNDGGVGHRVAAQIDALEIAHRLAVVDHVFERLVSQAKVVVPFPRTETIGHNFHKSHCTAKRSVRGPRCCGNRAKLDAAASFELLITHLAPGGGTQFLYDIFYGVSEWDCAPHRNLRNATSGSFTANHSALSNQTPFNGKCG
jgi:hypothetical protein